MAESMGTRQGPGSSQPTRDGELGEEQPDVGNPTSAARRTGAVWVVATAIIASLVMPVPRVRAAAPPSIVFILTDDQRVGTLSAMPHVEQDLVHRGVRFEDAFVTNPMCCPSRSAILTGRYSDSTDVWRNDPPDGGFQTFTSRGEDQSTIATWLQSAGYTTALIGKYLNGYDTDLGYVPPGWNRWFAIESQLYFGYDISDQGTVVHYGSARTDYSTNVLRNQAVDFIENTAGPLFLYFAPVAPHYPATPAMRDKGTFDGLAPWRPPSYAEKNVSDKPPYIQARTWSRQRQEVTDSFRRRQYETLQAVDRSVDDIVQALAATGRLSNTAIFFMSDNALLWGEHRWTGKGVPYEEAIHVPLILRYDPLGVTGVDAHLVLNVDIAPTIADLAGAKDPGVEGSSLIPLITGAAGTWRTDFPLEHLAEDPPRADDGPTYCGVRTERYMYARYQDGFEELYDLSADPYELRNIAPMNPTIVATLRARAQELCNPPPPGYTW